jgi:hypothetical protein
VARVHMWPGYNRLCTKGVHASEGCHEGERQDITVRLKAYHDHPRNPWPLVKAEFEGVPIYGLLLTYVDLKVLHAVEGMAPSRPGLAEGMAPNLLNMLRKAGPVIVVFAGKGDGGGGLYAVETKHLVPCELGPETDKKQKVYRNL